ncbi:hypothetical protein [Corynebacterium ulcerans]|uniref:hypothetical protein n=1 Tax=Corynebacterium ulcerans TaxID=65058 RepID=UPI0005B4E228|nr:hypothetical protein [Corynebacterium ulcerans]MBH5297498.1 hypothetical protein [Corynebacterium ulcerans]NOL58709.1 hypothetical protein [Corynebacterium ulcerans]NOM03236.1 hypothetical protein [Corynebacterium ulcerans]PLV99031.1 hypothetical protein BRL53_07280 [Corynebacterium ulcerans]
MSKTVEENLLAMKRMLRKLEPDHDLLREAISLGRDNTSALPPLMREYAKNYTYFQRDPMIIGLHAKLNKTGLGGLCLVKKQFPQSLRFTDETTELIWRKKQGFRSTPHQENPQLEIIPTPDRFVLFWDNPPEGKDVLTGISLQLFDNETPLEEARKLSRSIPLLYNPEQLHRGLFNPGQADNPKFNFGD